MDSTAGSTANAAAKKSADRFIKSIFDIRGDTMSFEELHQMMEENTIIHGSNMWILMMAILIASIGLNVNSTAVIIGAMLISPLMSGILTMGYSLATRDLKMLSKAFRRFGTQVCISLLTSTVYFLLSPLDIPTSEMIARTSPTLWDVLIALFGGIAGMIGNTRQKKSNVIPGVAIATALMPPLCTAGYGLATLQLRFLLGAFYLFAINTLFIMLSSAIVTKLLKVPYHVDADDRKQKKVKRLVTVITIITIIPSIIIGAVTVYETVVDKNISDYLEQEFVFKDTQVVQTSTDNINRTISVSLVGETVSDEIIERLEQELPNYNLQGYTLHITQNKPVEGENADKVTIAIQENKIAELEEIIKSQQNQLQELKSSESPSIDFKMLAVTAESIFPELDSCGCGMVSSADDQYILLTAESSEAISQHEQQIIENWLTAETGIDRAVLDISISEAADDETQPEPGI